MRVGAVAFAIVRKRTDRQTHGCDACVYIHAYVLINMCVCVRW